MKCSISSIGMQERIEGVVLKDRIIKIEDTETGENNIS
jgi:hypothetical protein